MRSKRHSLLHVCIQRSLTYIAYLVDKIRNFADHFVNHAKYVTKLLPQSVYQHRIVDPLFSRSIVLPF